MSVPLVVGICTFRMLNGPLSGTIYVKSGLPRRRGARKRYRQAETESRTSLAGPSDGSGTSDGGSANTSNARSAGRTTCAGPADGSGDGSKRAPISGGGGPGSEEGSPGNGLQPMKEMPGTPWAFAKVVNQGVQVAGVMQGLLKSEDEKMQLRGVELWVEIAFGKYSRSQEDERTTETEWTLPRPDRD